MVPRLATFAVDKGFWYSIPDHLADSVELGRIVRVPLSGRRTRGYVVEVVEERPGPLKAIAGTSGDYPVFDAKLLQALIWAAHHYVAPLSVMLDRTAPPNLPRVATEPKLERVAEASANHPLMAVARQAAAGKRRPVSAIVARSGPEDWLPLIAPVLANSRSVMVVVSTAAEATALYDLARRLFGVRAVQASGDVDRELTLAWVAAQGPGRVIIGTPRIAAWQFPQLSLSVVLEEGRRAMKDRQTPTIHVRELLIQRARLEGFSLAFMGPTPSLEVLAAGAEVARVGRRAWSLVEVVDRREEPPGAGYLSERALAALRGIRRGGGRSLVFTHRRLGDESMRCTNCRAVRICGVCGSRLGRASSCRRCGEEAGKCRRCSSDSFESMGTVPERLASAINRAFGETVAGSGSTSLPVSVGSESDLAGLGRFDLAVVADADGLIHAQHFRAGEEALRILGRLGNAVATGSGKRLMIQTSMPDSDVISTMRSGDPIPYLERLLVERARDRLPPAEAMMAVELRGVVEASDATAALHLDGVTSVLGPAEVEQGQRWLLQGDLRRAKIELRSLVQTWRDRGVTVRLDADPIDL